MIDSKFDETGEVPSAVFAIGGTLALAAIPPIWILMARGPVSIYLALGAASWALAFILKVLLMRVPAIRSATHRGLMGAAAWGLFSGTSELGATFLLIRFYGYPRNALEIIAVGVGVSTVEIIYVLGAAIVGHLRGQVRDELEAWIKGARRSGWVRHMLLIERLSATFGHVGSRGLLCVALLSGRIWLAAVALFLFSAVDAVATFGRGRKWNWCNPEVARTFYAFVLLVGLVEVGGFAWAYG